ncbi:hypothetical protein ABES02_29170 [Neobacillus pocheonensis]|uniref:hypothetical protein n=1 Tax=Neobacillus pocheonensis TaxID=363869 RepID=UPI003D27D2AA
MEWVVKSTLKSGKVFEEYEDGSCYLNGKPITDEELAAARLDLKQGNFYNLILRDTSKG